jgi:hypothetical protein
MGLRHARSQLDRLVRGQVDTAPHLPSALLSAVHREHLTHTVELVSPSLSPAESGTGAIAVKFSRIGDRLGPKYARPEAGLLRVNLTGNALIRPISARYSAGLSLRVSERILVSRLES